jgi:endonuclease YncB( thermonuclease family)
MWRTFARLLLSAMLACGLYPVATHAYEVSSYAIVNEDGTLQIKGKTVRLFGIYIPDTGRTCARNRLPPVCGSRASVALEFKIDGFVTCKLLERNPEMGWAVALPDAPFEYQTLEKIARSRGFGVWGMPVDRVIDRK